MSCQKPAIPLPPGCSWTRSFYLLLMLLVWLAACQSRRPTASLTVPPPSPTGTDDPTAHRYTPSPTEVLAPTSTESATPVAAETEPALTPESTPEPFPSPAPEPLHITFPTPAKGIVSAWRPPLYPIPWVPTFYDHFYFARPIPADQINLPRAEFRYGGVYFEEVIHTGIDYPCPKGTPVLAAGAGKVIWADYGVFQSGQDESDPYGLAVVIRHDFGYQGQTLYSLYGHMDRVDVMAGQHVEVGEQIGLVGETGKTTGPHLHFEVRLGYNDYYMTRNPELWIVPPQGWGVVAGRVMNTRGQLISGVIMIVTNYYADHWTGETYSPSAVHSDPYYRENVVISDLPAGKYSITVAYEGVEYTTNKLVISPGLVSYFEFRGAEGFTIGPPPQLSYDPLTTPTPTP